MSVNGDVPYVELKENNSAFRRRIYEFDLVNNGYRNIEEFLIAAYESYKEKIIKVVTEYMI